MEEVQYDTATQENELDRRQDLPGRACIGL